MLCVCERMRMCQVDYGQQSKLGCSCYGETDVDPLPDVPF